MPGEVIIDSDLILKGKAKIDTVPNSIGTVMTYNSTTKELGTRTNAQIISDLGLINATNIASAYYTKTQLQTSGQSAVHWNNLTNIPATFYPSTHTHTIPDVTGLQTALDGKALNTNVVHKTGNETINGTKTFDSSPIVPNGTLASHAVNLSQLDNLHQAITTGGLYNPADSVNHASYANKSYFDYNWGGSGFGLGSVINFSGLNGYYSTEFYGSYNGTQIFGARTRNGDSGLWNAPVKFWHDGNFNPSSFNQTLTTGFEGEHGQIIYLSNGGQITMTNHYLTSRDSPTRNPNDIAPNQNPRQVRFDFVTAASIGGTGNFVGVMTYAPWDGTSGSTGDSSYQLAFGNKTGINGTGKPLLKIRKGIDSTWSSDWYEHAIFETNGDLNVANDLYVDGEVRSTKQFVAEIPGGSTNGGQILKDVYVGQTHFMSFGFERSSGNPYWGRGYFQNGVDTDYKSSHEIPWIRNGIHLTNTGLIYKEAPTQTTAFGNSVTGLVDYTIWTSKNFTQANLNTWLNMAVDYVNTTTSQNIAGEKSFTNNLSISPRLAMKDSVYGLEKFIINANVSRIVARKSGASTDEVTLFDWSGVYPTFQLPQNGSKMSIGHYHDHYNSEGEYNLIIGAGGIRVTGSVKATGNFKSDAGSKNTLFIPDGTTSTIEHEILNEGLFNTSIRLRPLLLKPSDKEIIDDNHRLIRLYCSESGYIEIVPYALQDYKIYNTSVGDVEIRKGSTTMVTLASGYCTEITVDDSAIMYIEEQVRFDTY